MLDLGMAAKPRPCLILSVPFRDDEKAVVTYVARTTQTRGGRFEVEHPAPQFLPGVFDAQNVGTVPVANGNAIPRPVARGKALGGRNRSATLARVHHLRTRSRR
jgi:mRNA-degrading endonuclease toxin of MazEF toxin-antitoxin module